MKKERKSKNVEFQVFGCGQKNPIDPSEPHSEACDLCGAPVFDKEVRFYPHGYRPEESRIVDIERFVITAAVVRYNANGVGRTGRVISELKDGMVTVDTGWEQEDWPIEELCMLFWSKSRVNGHTFEPPQMLH